MFPASAGDILLSINSGEESDVFWIEGEPSLVMNGFDLSAYAEDLPLALDAVTISVETPVVGARAVVVVYEDANAGSPYDAELVYRQNVSINEAGDVRIELQEPAFIQEEVAWVGIYLPVGFRFFADTSGSSPLTYWAWTPGGPFDLSSPSRAMVLGPGDGSAPVNIQMDGLARISAEIRSSTSLEVARLRPLGQQIADATEYDTSNFVEHANCPGLFYDPDDLAGFPDDFPALSCLVGSPIETPVEVLDSPEGFIDVQREGTLYKIVAENATALPKPVTHCIRAIDLHLESAVLGEAVDIPERWRILPSVRYGDLVCAEVGFTNYVSYFLPRSPDAVQNVNLVVGWSRVEPHPFVCGLHSRITAAIVNTGREDFFTNNGKVQFSVENIHLPSNTIGQALDESYPTWEFQPGWRKALDVGTMRVTDPSMIGDRFRLQIRADTNYQVAETSEADNTWFTEYILRPISTDNQCDPGIPPPLCDPLNYDPRSRNLSPNLTQRNNIRSFSPDKDPSKYPYHVEDPGEEGFGDGPYGYCSCLRAHYFPADDCLEDYVDAWEGDLDLRNIDRGEGICRADEASLGSYLACVERVSSIAPGWRENAERAWLRIHCYDDNNRRLTDDLPADCAGAPPTRP